jgi:hypothetical protein
VPEMEIFVGYKIMHNIRFEIFTAVMIHVVVFSIMTPYSLVEKYPLNNLKHGVIFRINIIFGFKILYEQKNSIPSIVT